jgi:hypothetical protein
VVSLVSFAIAIGAVGAISKFASRRGLEKLHTSAMGTGTWIALLLLASLGAQSRIDYTPFDPDRSMRSASARRPPSSSPRGSRCGCSPPWVPRLAAPPACPRHNRSALTRHKGGSSR